MLFLWETHCKCLGRPFLGHVQSSILSNMWLLWFFLYQAVYQDTKIEQLNCRRPATSAKGCIPLWRSVAHQDWPGDEVICACAVIFCALQTQLLSGTGQCEMLGSVSGHFSHHHSFPSLETDWSISFFCLFHMETNGSFPSVPAALKGFLVSPEYIMQFCRAIPFFLFSSMPLSCIVICLLWLGSSYRITAKFCFTQQCLVFSLGAMYSLFKMFVRQYQSWLIPSSFGWQEEEKLEVSCASYRTNTALFTLAKLPLPSTKVGFETRAANLVSDIFVQATVSPRAGYCFC